MVSRSDRDGMIRLYVYVLMSLTLRVSAARQDRDGFTRAAHPQLLKVHVHDDRIPTPTR